MALIECIECGKEISDKADTCTNCGCPTEGSIKQAMVTETFAHLPEEELYLTICNQCSGYRIITRKGITNSIIRSGSDHCMTCGGSYKIIDGLNNWFSKDETLKTSIAEKELTRVKQGDEFSQGLANRYGQDIRPDLNVIGYCPKCGRYYEKNVVVKNNISECEFCQTTIEFSDMLKYHYSSLVFDEMRKRKLKFDNYNLVSNDLIKTLFLSNSTIFDPELYKQQLIDTQHKKMKKRRTITQNSPQLYLFLYVCLVWRFHLSFLQLSIWLLFPLSYQE